MTAGRLRGAVAAILLLPLAACTNMSGLDGESRYACAAPQGVACDSVSGTYANAIRNNLPSQGLRLKAPTPGANTSANTKVPLKPPAGTLATPNAESPPPQALRSQPRYLRLWIKPWEDTDGDLFDQTTVYVQIDHGHWQIDHVRQAILDRYAPLRPPPAASAEAASTASPGASADPASAVQRPPGFSGFPMLSNSPSPTGERAAGSRP
jgi:conjugal transfer pilus assembly protein TraV